MAEAAAIIGLVSAITSLVDLSAKVVSRLQEYSSKTVDVPQSFQSLSSRLPLLVATLQRIQKQIEAGRLPSDVAQALKGVVDTTAEQVSIVFIYLHKILPARDASRFERVLKAMKSVPKDEKVQLAVERIHKNIDFLVLHQTTRNVDMGDRIIEELSKMNLSLSTSLVPSASLFSFGVCLGSAPTIAPEAFVGREVELQQLRSLLSPKSRATQHQNVSIVGMGGMGKTQLSLAHVRDCGTDYTSVFWLNAKDETSLRQSLARLGSVIFPEFTASTVVNADEEKQQIDKVRQWLSVAGNDQWLLIFDNYDDLNLPGARSSTGYDIRPFFPARAQGSILITSRSTNLTFSTQIKLQRIKNDSTSVAILSQRCGRDVSAEAGALELVQRLGGLPLALATAGSFLTSIEMSCTEYLILYESAWVDLVGPDSKELLEYEARTLSSTWNISLEHIRRQDGDAAKLLAFFAYFDNNDIWYELVKGGSENQVPWLRRVTKTKVSFQRTMSKLLDYSLVDVVGGIYQIHPCLHDWLVETLNNPLDSQLFITALECISENLATPGDWPKSRRFLKHMEHLESPKFDVLWDVHRKEKQVIKAAETIADFEALWDLKDKAERTYQRALTGLERLMGSEHERTLEIVHRLALIHLRQKKFNQAEEMLLRVLSRQEKTLELKHPSILSTIRSLGLVYDCQGRLDEAEQMYQRALTATEEALGPKHMGTLEILQHIGSIYIDQGRLGEADKLFQRVLIEREKLSGPMHTSTLSSVHYLGVLYQKQGKLDQAEEMVQRALVGHEKLLGPEHRLTLRAVYNLLSVYKDQGRKDDANRLVERFSGIERYAKAMASWRTTSISTTTSVEQN